MKNLRQTHTFATLEISKSAWMEIFRKLEKANYDHCLIPDEDGIVETIDMDGIGLVIKKEKE